MVIYKHPVFVNMFAVMRAAQKFTLETWRIELQTGQLAPTPTFMDSVRIELTSPQCECDVLPLYYEPKFWCGGENDLLYRLTTSP